MVAEAPANRVGQVLLGKLQVVRWIGGGGMGDVYEVEHLLTHHRRALKIVRPEHAKERRFVERLLREASIAGRLGTPYVVETLDAGRLEDGSAYVLMELLDGRSLQDLLEEDGKLSQKRVASLLCQVAEGVAIAHAAGIVHRDLKPENIFVIDEGDGRERVKILDFGISKFLEGAAAAPSKLTREGTVLGTPFYMAPEQASGRDVDGRSDVWSMGVIMYEALTGRLPFEGSTVGELFIQIGAGQFVPLEHRRPDLDLSFVSVVAGALRADPDDRYPSAEALRRDLLPFAASEPASRAKTISDGVRAEVIGGPLPPPPSLPSKTLEDTIRRSSRPPRVEEPAAAAPARFASSVREPLRGAAVVAALLATIALSVLAWRSFQPRARPVAEPSTAPAAVVEDPEPPALERATIAPDAGTVATTAIDEPDEPDVPDEARVDRPERPRRPRTRAEVAGLEANPYGP